MRLLIDARKAFDSGIGTYIRCVMPRVIELLPDVSFSAMVEPGGAERHDYLLSQKVTFVEMKSPPLGLLEQVELRHLTQRADVFWATSLAHPLFSSAPMIATVHDVAQLATRVHGAGDLLVKAAARLYFRSLRTTARLLFFNSTFTRSEFERYVGRIQSNGQVTPLGVDLGWFDHRHNTNVAPPSRPYLVCVGNLRPHKNLLLLLQAYMMVKTTVPHDLLLVGKPEGFHALDTATKAALADLGDRVRFTGFLSDAELRACVGAADGMVVPSLYEGFGLPALEAMAAGIPVIAARAAALPEVCGDCADYFDPTSRESLAQRLRCHAVMVPEARKARISRGIARARSFSWDQTALLTAEAIATLLPVGRPR